jgi:hypothetical protein
MFVTLTIQNVTDVHYAVVFVAHHCTKFLMLHQQWGPVIMRNPTSEFHVPYNQRLERYNLSVLGRTLLCALYGRDTARQGGWLSPQFNDLNLILSKSW